MPEHFLHLYRTDHLFEYAYESARLAKENGLLNIFVTNGYMTKEALEMIRPYLDAANVDLKFFTDEGYRRVCGGSLQPVLDTISLMRKLGIWVEVTTLIVPGENDSAEELKDIASFLAGVGKEIPWHISRFHPDYKMTDKDSTPLSKLKEAYNIGKKAGLRYVYIGNVLEEEKTFCYKCQKGLISRMGFEVIENNLKSGACPSCGAVLDRDIRVKPKWIRKTVLRLAICQINACVGDFPGECPQDNPGHPRGRIKGMRYRGLPGAGGLRISSGRHFV